MSLGQPLDPSAFNDWFPFFRILVDRLVRDMDDLLSEDFDLDKPALAVELADTAWRWAVENDSTARAQAWDEGAESAYFDPSIRGQVNYPDNPYRLGAPVALDPSGPEVSNALAGLPGVSDQCAVSFTDEGPLTSPTGELEIDHERGRLGAVGIGRSAPSRDRSTNPELQVEGVILHGSIVGQLEEPDNGTCDGCNVRESWEHRCHGEPCACEECREERRIFETPGVVTPPGAPGGDS